MNKNKYSFLAIFFYLVSVLICALFYGIHQEQKTESSKYLTCPKKSTECSVVYYRFAGDSIKTGDWQIIVTEITIANSYKTLPEILGSQYVVVKLIIQNTNPTEAQSINSDMEFSVRNDMNNLNFFVDAEQSALVGSYDTNIIYEPQDIGGLTLVFRTPKHLDFNFIANVFDFGKVTVPVKNITVDKYQGGESW